MVALQSKSRQRGKRWEAMGLAGASSSSQPARIRQFAGIDATASRMFQQTMGWMSHDPNSSRTTPTPPKRGPHGPLEGRIGRLAPYPARLIVHSLASGAWRGRIAIKRVPGDGKYPGIGAVSDVRSAVETRERLESPRRRNRRRSPQPHSAAPLAIMVRSQGTSLGVHVFFHVGGRQSTRLLAAHARTRRQQSPRPCVGG